MGDDGRYPGELHYQFSYRGQRGDPVPQLFLDFGQLGRMAAGVGLQCDLVAEEEDLYLAVECREHEALREIYAEWMSGKRPLPGQDRAVLKRAMKAYRKRLKLARLDDESSSGRNPLSKGETLRLTLRFETAGEISVDLPVLAIGAAGPNHSGRTGDVMTGIVIAGA